MHNERLKLALAIIVIRSRRPWETTTITLQRFLALIEEADIAAKVLESAINLSSQILLNAMVPDRSNLSMDLHIEVLKRLSCNITSAGMEKALPLISGLDDDQVCQLLAYSDSFCAGKSIDNIIISVLDGEGRDIAVRITALLNHVHNHVPSQELVAKLIKTINCNDALVALSGISLAKKLLFSTETFASFLDSLWPQRAAWF